MSIAYAIIRAESFLRSAQIDGSDQDELETAYTAAFTGDPTGVLDGAEVPISSFKAQILNIESEISHIIAADASHPYRTYLAGTSAPLANLADTPSSDANSKPFIGVFDSVTDGSSGQPLTLQPTQTILDERDSFFDTIDLYNYAIVGNTIQHTRATAVMQGCVWDRADQEAEYDADGNSPLPPILANTWIAGVMANLPQVGWTDSAGVAGMYNGIYQQGIQILRQGTGSQVNLPLASQTNAASG